MNPLQDGQSLDFTEKVLTLAKLDKCKISSTITCRTSGSISKVFGVYSTLLRNFCSSAQTKYVALADDKLPKGTGYQPSSTSNLTQTFAFGYSLFYPNTRLDPFTFEQSLKNLQQELPALGSRVEILNYRNRLSDVSLNLAGNPHTGDRGVEISYCEDNHLLLTDLGLWSWTAGYANKTLEEFSVPFYAPKFDIKKMLKGKEPLLKFRILRCADGDVMSMGISHILADAGRAVRLLERLAEHYQAVNKGTPLKTPPLIMNPILESPQGFAAALEDNSIPNNWKPAPFNASLTMSQLLSAPKNLMDYKSKKFDVHILHLPAATINHMKKIAVKSPGEGLRISSMDAVQGFFAVLNNSLRNRPLVPMSPAELTVNVDLLHRDLRFKNSADLQRHIGNTVIIHRIKGLSDYNKSRPPQSMNVREQLCWALQSNATLIRKAVQGFRADPSRILQELSDYEAIANSSKSVILTKIIVEAAKNKCSSTTAINGFKFDKVDFGTGQPSAVQINYQPRFDWCTIIQQAPRPQDGVICHMTVASGLAEDISRSPVLKYLAPGSKLIPAMNLEQVEQELDRRRCMNAKLDCGYTSEERLAMAA